MEKTIVDAFYESSSALARYLDENSQPSFKSDVDSNYKKGLLLSAASYFEMTIVQTLITVVKEKTDESTHVIDFFRHRAIGDKYFQLFEWKERKAGKFWSFFGKEFKKHVEGLIDDSMETSIAAFLEIGEWRNKLVHQNFAAFDLPKTNDEIYQLYKAAILFPPFLYKSLIEYNPLKEGRIKSMKATDVTIIEEKTSEFRTTLRVKR